MAKKKQAPKSKARRQERRRAPRRLRLHVIPAPAPNTRSVINFMGEGTVVMRGEDNVTMECGKCGAPLLENMRTAQVVNMVFVCNRCGSYNESILL